MPQNFDFQETRLKGAYLIKPFCTTDIRGAFIKDYNVNTFATNGIDHVIKEVFYTISKKGVIRAIHFQAVKQQAKLVRCIKGNIYDVIVDLRKESPTFGQWEGFYLSDRDNMCVYVPEHFGHGYLVLEDSIVSYKCGEIFYGEYDSGIMYDDQNIGIQWPFERIDGIENLIISDKDLNLMSFSQFKNNL